MQMTASLLSAQLVWIPRQVCWYCSDPTRATKSPKFALREVPFRVFYKNMIFSIIGFYHVVVTKERLFRESHPSKSYRQLAR